MQYKEEIKKLKKERDAVILVHNYQSPEVQDIADHLGDSYDLSLKAASISASVIVFCGVSFMAETAKILAPMKTVLHPVREARCPMADMAREEEIARLRKKYPEASVMAYVNTNARTKALTDVICTSANAVKIASKLPSKDIIFLPDKNLGRFIQKKCPKKRIILSEGYCYVHEDLEKDELLKIRKAHPSALILTHPEANEEVSALSDHLMGTGEMLKFVKNSDVKEFIIGTEEGLIYRLRNENPGKEFYPLQPRIICRNMKKIGLKDVYLSLLENKYGIELPEDVMISARIPLQKMLELSE